MLDVLILIPMILIFMFTGINIVKFSKLKIGMINLTVFLSVVALGFIAREIGRRDAINDEKVHKKIIEIYISQIEDTEENRK